ncbi:MAG TPA: His/Gly/Thr/Pro-type tRNA ligase C-terminal domain-containing protein [Kofleriaceae bacterium]|nr:His/Gly/Thr/Pro-type tRNA ligase C-terminal domain-containing protein [Kofleriaceae bacterium]
MSADHAEAAAAVVGRLARAGLRSRLDGDGATLARRIAAAHHDGVPFAVVVGDRERAEHTLAVRARDGRWSAPIDEAVADLVRRCAVS